MSEPAITPTGDGAGDVRGLDARGVVEAIVASRRAADAHEARVLALAVHFVDLHPVTPQHPAATWDPDEKLPVISLLKPKLKPKRGAVAPPAGQTRKAGCTQRIAGEGTPGVAEYAVEELGAALGISYRSALQLVADALELCYRLPRLWGLVQAGRLQTWKARQVAQLTIDVPPVVASFVDRHLAFHAAKNRVPTLGRLRALVHEALLQHDPDTATAREETALAKRGVWFDHRDSTATTAMTATLDTLDALDLDTTLADLADQLRRLGDDSPLDVRRAHALGALAHPQHLLDLTSTGENPQQEGPEHLSAHDDGGAGERPVLQLRNKTTAHLYVHVSLADLITGTGTGTGTGSTGEPVVPTGWVERLGPATLDLLRDWLTRADRIQLRPVLHAVDPDGGGTRGTRGPSGNGGDWPAVDQHDPPEWMRETVILRDGHCVFPGCSTDARGCDQDHIVPYVPVDEGGPPGQTSADSLACLCRRHHRLKTLTAWRYRRLPDGDYEWTSPTGHTYTANSNPRR